MSWWPFKSTASVIPINSRPTGAPLDEVVVVTNTPPIISGATAPRLPRSTIRGVDLMAGTIPQSKEMREYVALGGSRKSKASNTSKTSKASKTSKTSKKKGTKVNNSKSRK